MGRILVVEDDANTRDGLTELLREIGHEVDAAASAEEAVGMLSRSPFDLVITDLRLPGMSGLELFGHLKSCGRCPRAILITAYDHLEIRHTALRAGFDTVLPKPVDIDKLLEVIDRATVEPKDLPTGDLAA